MVQGTRYKVHGLLLVWSLLLVGCSQSASTDFIHFGTRTQVVEDSDTLDPELDYLSEFQQLDNQRIASFRTLQVGDSTLTFPVSSDDFNTLKYIQQTLITQLMGAEYADDYIEHAVQNFCSAHPERQNQLALTTCYNNNNIYACRTGNRYFTFCVSSGRLLHLQDIFQGDYHGQFWSALGRTDSVSLANFCINAQGVVFLVPDATGQLHTQLVDKAIAHEFLNDKWKHLWR